MELQSVFKAEVTRLFPYKWAILAEDIRLFPYYGAICDEGTRL